MSSLTERLKKNSKIKETASLLESKFFEAKEQIVTDVPALNIALSGRLDGGLQAGLMMVAGPSKHFKSSICLVMAAAYQKKYDDGVILFYDSEFGSLNRILRLSGLTLIGLFIPLLLILSN